MVGQEQSVAGDGGQPGEEALPQNTEVVEEDFGPSKEDAMESQVHMSASALDVPEDIQKPHIVLLGDSTLDNGRYLNLAFGELSVEKQLSKRCIERGWEMTILAQDGSLLDDVLVRQLPLIPDHVTHIVLSASGNDLLSLLNQMVVANFTIGSMYSAIGEGLKQVSARYHGLLQTLKGLGCHLACCTVYRPNFNHIFFKSLAIFSLGMHNSRITQTAVDLDCSVIDLANMFDCQEDFANPLELSTRGGAKVVENVTHFVQEHSVLSLHRYRHNPQILNTEDDAFLPATTFGISMQCCVTRAPRHKVYASKKVPKALEQPDRDIADRASALGRPLAFSEAQQQWRDGDA